MGRWIVSPKIPEQCTDFVRQREVIVVTAPPQRRPKPNRSSLSDPQSWPHANPDGRSELFLGNLLNVHLKLKWAMGFEPMTPTLARFSAAAVVKVTVNPFWQAARPRTRATWVLPVPELPSAITFSRLGEPRGIPRRYDEADRFYCRKRQTRFSGMRSTAARKGPSRFAAFRTLSRPSGAIQRRRAYATSHGRDVERSVESGQLKPKPDFFPEGSTDVA